MPFSASARRRRSRASATVLLVLPEDSLCCLRPSRQRMYQNVEPLTLMMLPLPYVLLPIVPPRVNKSREPRVAGARAESMVRKTYAGSNESQDDRSVSKSYRLGCGAVQES